MAGIGFSSFAGQNWLITPTALAVNQAKPANIADQMWFIHFSGVGVLDRFTGNNANDWLRAVLVIFPDVNAPLKFAINRYGVPVPTLPNNRNVTPSIVVDQIVPYAAVSSAFEKSTGVDFGFAVDAWRPNPFFSGPDVHGQHVGNVFTGIDVDVAIRNNSATMHRVSYQITIIGKIAFFETR